MLTQNVQRHVSFEAQCRVETECAAHQITMARTRCGDIPYIAGRISFAAITYGWSPQPPGILFLSALLFLFFISFTAWFSASFSFFLNNSLRSLFWTSYSVHIGHPSLSLYISHTQSHLSTSLAKTRRKQRKRTYCLDSNDFFLI